MLMSPFETPPQPKKDNVEDLHRESKKNLEALYRLARMALTEDDNQAEALSEKSKEALLAWLDAAQAEAKKVNTPQANVEVVIRKAELFMAVGRYEAAWPDVSYALAIVRRDKSISQTTYDRLQEIIRELDEKTGGFDLEGEDPFQ